MDNEKNYFSWSELTTTDTGLLNNPTSPIHLVNLARVWNYLNNVREKLREPIFVNSAFRTLQVNEQVGGAKCSNHIKGLAADIRTSPLYMERLTSILYDDYNTGKLSELHIYPTFIHIAL